MKSKKAVMGFAVILIFLYHFYVPVTSWAPEALIYRTGYMAVDYFIFCSARSLGSKGVIRFRPFLRNRLVSVYIPFCIFTAMAALYKSWSLRRFAEVIFGIKLLTNGGAAFLWYFPAIMIIYLFVPLMSSAKQKYGYRALAAAFLIWLAGAAVMQYGFGYTGIFVMWNRLPLFFAGFWWKDTDAVTKNMPAKVLAGIVLGLILVAEFCWEDRLNVPLKDIYYVFCGVLVIAVSQGFEWICRKGKKLRILEWLGGISGAMYGLQMTFGKAIMERLTALAGVEQIAFVLTFVLMVAMAYAFTAVYGKAVKAVKR